ncbi:ribosome biogenesis protein NOP53 [Microcaecilia unicolor]|uniref:Ribosome biogenesis protein NOP53 n=1 Tax=Microcaecilia unicolor TaxID=1415580 RepID=A0A6P7ZEQ4_9AMPH|nr:ribosome biogenesis protein NOP53 [Microcaecilia unicolor]
MAAPSACADHTASFLGLESGSLPPRIGGRRKRLNRNKKKTWKRHCQAQDVEEFLEDVRLQERTAGGLVAEKSDDSLFFVDTRNEEKDLKLNKGKQKPLRIDLILQPDSKILPPKDILAHQIPNSKKLKRQKELQKRLEKRGIVPRKQRLLQARLHRPFTKSKTLTNNQPDRDFYDIWGDANPLDSALAGKDSWFLEQTKKRAVERPSRLNLKPSPLPAVEVIASGGSYNPSFQSHQALLLQAHEAELKRLKQEERLERQLSFPTVDKAPTKESAFQELCQGLLEESEEEEDVIEQQEKNGVEAEGTAVPQAAAAAAGEKKTERQRKREKEARALTLKLQAEKAVKQKQQELFQLRSIKTEVKHREEELSQRKVKRAEKRKAQAARTRRLGKLKYEAPDTEVQLSEELTGSLRTLKPEGSILKDRFKSFQKRNLIEPRERAKFKRKYKLKYTEKRAFREVTI